MDGKIKAVGFDFDGTLIMSEEQKAKAMADIFQDLFHFQKIRQKSISEAYKKISRRGLSREQKIKLLFQKLLHRQPTRMEFSKVTTEFGQRYQQSMNTCPLFQCSNLIKELRKQVKFIFLLSLENRKEVMAIAKHCGVAKYFTEILGGPKPKAKNLWHVLQKHHLKPSEVLYIGDAHSDVIAGKKLKIKVVLLGKRHTYERLKEDLEADFVFSSLCDVPKAILN